MDLVKRGRNRIKEGDCVSIKSGYFGDAFEQQMVELGFNDGVVYGRVTEVLDGNSDFTVTWDIDGQISKHMTLQKVQLESKETPKQCISSSSVITSEDFQTSDQCSSKTAASTHALLFEADLPSYYLLRGDKKCFKAQLYPTKPGTLVHNKALLDSQEKFLISEIIDNDWDGFDEDFHCVGSFLVWEREQASPIEESKSKEAGKNTTTKTKRGRKKKFELKIVTRESKTLKDQDEEAPNNARSRKKPSKRGKQKVAAGKKFRQMVNQGESDLLSSDEDEQADPQPKAKHKKTVKAKKQVVLNKLANQQESESEIETETDENQSDSASSDSEDDDENNADPKKKKDAWKKEWKKGGWTMDPNERQPYGPKLNLPDFEVFDEIGYLFRFLPIDFIRDVIIPATNKAGCTKKGFKDISVQEFVNFLGLMYSMEIVQLPDRRMYWGNKMSESSIFPDINFSQYMSRNRFEEILSILQFSSNPDKDEQIIEFLSAVNDNLFEAVTPGNIITLDESMIKSYHRNLKGKIKIKRKPRPIGNEIKDLADARSNIAVKLELYEGKDIMKDKEHVSKYGATCATTLRLTEDYQGSGRVVIADSWFGSVKTAINLKKVGLYSIMIVKTAHKLFPRESLDSHKLEKGEWVAYTATFEDVPLQAVSFQDIKKKQFISTCSTIVAGKPRKSKHHGDINRPKVAEYYLNHAASIDIHNHVRTGSKGLEDVLLTKSPHVRQFTGILGFLFTNSYLAYRYFKPNEAGLAHLTFKMALSKQMVEFKESSRAIMPRRLPLHDNFQLITNSHQTGKLPYPKPCYYCRHGYEKSERITTTFECLFCKIPIHKSSYNRDCWNLHITKGVPNKRRLSKN